MRFPNLRRVWTGKESYNNLEKRAPGRKQRKTEVTGPRVWGESVKTGSQEVRRSSEGKVSYSGESENTVLWIFLTEPLWKSPVCLQELKHSPHSWAFCWPQCPPTLLSDESKCFSCCFPAGQAASRQMQSWRWGEGFPRNASAVWFTRGVVKAFFVTSRKSKSAPTHWVLSNSGCQGISEGASTPPQAKLCLLELQLTRIQSVSCLLSGISHA